jgi:hypothetical protein
MSPLEGLKRRLKQIRWVRPLRFAYFERRLRRTLSVWSRLLSAEDKAGLARTKIGRRILVATSVGMHPFALFDGLLAVALAVRGADVGVLLCDATLPACMMCEVNWFQGNARFADKGPREFCRMCPVYAERMFQQLGVRVYRYSDFLAAEDRRLASETANQTPFADIPALMLDGIAIGEQAVSGALRYFARSDLEGEPEGELVLRRYLEAAVLASRAGNRLMQTERFDAVVLHHGIYVPQGTLAAEARKAGMRVVTWHQAYRHRCFIFSHGDTYHHTLMNEPVEAWANIAWNEKLDARIGEYLFSRRYGKRDWISFGSRAPALDFGQIAASFGIDNRRPLVVLLSNVVWDAQLHYPANAFPTMMHWVKDTVAFFAARPDLQLVIRVHPAEVTGSLPSRQKLVDELQAAFPVLPENVKVIPPEHPASTYAVVEKADSVLVFGTKMGVELSSIGIPVIVAGEAWIRNKGVTIDVTSRDEYLKTLSRLPMGERMNSEQVKRARKYAYHFFFRRMIPVEAVVPAKGSPPFAIGITSLADLAPGVSKGMDIICSGILEGQPFIYPAEEEPFS